MVAGETITDSDWRAIRRYLRAYADREGPAGHWADGSDHLQEAIAESAHCPDHIRTGTREQALNWLRGVLRHKMQDATRAQLWARRRQTPLGVVDEPPDRGPSPSWVATAPAP